MIIEFAVIWISRGAEVGVIVIVGYLILTGGEIDKDMRGGILGWVVDCLGGGILSDIREGIWLVGLITGERGVSVTVSVTSFDGGCGPGETVFRAHHASNVSKKAASSSVHSGSGSLGGECGVPNGTRFVCCSRLDVRLDCIGFCWVSLCRATFSCLRLSWIAPGN